MRRLDLLISAALVLIVAAIAGGAAFGFSKSQPIQYSSTAELYFGGSQGLEVLGAGYTPTGTDVPTQMASEQALATSYDIARATAAASPNLHLSADRIDSDITASTIAGTQLIQLSATGATPIAAQQLISSYIVTYQRLRRQQEQTQATKVAGVLRARYAALPIREKAGALGSTLRSQIGALNVLQGVGSGIPSVAQAPRVGAAPSQPKTSRNVLYGVVFGLILGAGLVALRSSQPRRLPQDSAAVDEFAPWELPSAPDPETELPTAPDPETLPAHAEQETRVR